MVAAQHIDPTALDSRVVRRRHGRVTDLLSFENRSEWLYAVFKPEVERHDADHVSWGSGSGPNELVFYPFELSSAVFKLMFPGLPVPGDAYPDRVLSFRADVAEMRARLVGGQGVQPCVPSRLDRVLLGWNLVARSTVVVTSAHSGGRLEVA